MRRHLLSLLALLATCVLHAQTIELGPVAPAALCAGSTVVVPFTVSGSFDGANVFTAELSSPAGSFASPVGIGSVAAAGSGSISASIPSGTPGGGGYRIRIRSSAPALTSNDNGVDLTISQPPSLTISGNTVVCPGKGSVLVASGAAGYSWSPGPLPVDAAAANARMAVGLRLLSSNYSGPILRLRRSSDGAEADFGASGNDLDVAAIDAWRGSATVYCVKLYDQSGNGNHVTQVTAASQPQLVPAAGNGRPALVFNTSQFMRVGTAFAAPYTVTFAARQTGGTRGRVLSSVSNNWLLGWWSNGRNAAYFEGWVHNTSGTYPADNSRYVYSGASSGSISYLYENGSLVTSNSNGVAAPNGLQLNGSGVFGERSDCEFYDVLVYNSVLPASTRAAAETSMWGYYQAPNQYFVNLSANETKQITVTGTAPGCASSTQTVTVSNSVPGDPTVFGNNEWRVYAWNGGTYYNDGSAWSQHYSGYYTAPGLNFNTQNQWAAATAPSNAPGYQGCPINTDLHSWSAKRQGFPCGYYRLNIPALDEFIQLWINGVKVYEAGCCGNGNAVWTGYLSATDSIEFRGSDYSGNSYGSLNFTIINELGLSYPVPTQCNNAGPLSPVQTGPKSGAYTSRPAGLVIDAGTGIIDPATSAPGTYTVVYTAAIDSVCAPHVDSISTTVSIAQHTGDPAAFGTNEWKVYVFNAGGGSVTPQTWNANYSGYYTEPLLGFNTQNRWSYTGAPSSASGYQGCPVAVDYHSWSAKRRGFPCGYYRVNVPWYDDVTQLFINGEKVYHSNVSGSATWIGYLTDTSTVEFRVSEATGGSGGQISFTIEPEAVIKYPFAVYCTTSATPLPSITGAAGGSFSASPAGLVIDAATGAVDLAASTEGNYTITYSADRTECSVRTLTATTTMRVQSVKGDPGQYGNGTWNVYVWNAGGSSNTGDSWNTNYSGYYTVGGLNFNTQSQWSNGGAPSEAPGYQGCAVSADLHSWSAKRQGFPCGYYRLDIGGHDDEGELWVNGVRVWTHRGCCDAHNGAWTGYLSDTDRVEFRVTEGSGGSNGNLTFTKLVTASILYPSSPYCHNGGTAAVTRTGDSTGHYIADAGLVIDSASGLVDLNASTPGVHTVSYIVSHLNCLPDTAVASIEITGAPTATIAYSKSAFCSNDAVAPVTRSGSAGGTFSATPSGLSIDAATGTITPATSAAGLYTVTYTIAASGLCQSYSTTTTVRISTKPAATIAYTGSPYCANGGTATVTLTGTPGGVFSSPYNLALDPATGSVNLGNGFTGGSYVYYTLNVPGCAELSTYSYFQIDAVPTAMINYAGGTYYVGGGIMSVTRTGAAGGTYNATPSGLSINTTTGALNLDISSVGTYVVSYTLPSGNCPGSVATDTVEVRPTASAQITYSGNPFCVGAGIRSVTQTGLNGGTYSAAPSGLSINSSTGEVNVGTSTPGSYTVTYHIPAGNGRNEVTATANVTITGTPSAGISYAASPYCHSATSVLVAHSGSGGGTYSAMPTGLSINAGTGTINPSASDAGTYTVTYSIPATGGCPAFSTSTSVTINESATVSSPAAQVVCAGAATDAVTFTGGAPGTVYQWTNSYTPIGLPASGTGDLPSFTASNSGTVTHTATITVTPVNGSNGCTGTPKSFSISVKPTPAVTIQGGGSALCGGQSATLTATAGSSYLWSTGETTRSIDAGTAGTYTVSVMIDGCTGTASKTVAVLANHAPTLAYTGATSFTSSVVSPASGLPTSLYRFEVRYTDADGDLPQSNTLKLLLDYEGNGSYNNGNDRLFYLSEKDPSDQNVTDGKDYYFITDALPASANWRTRIEATDQPGCSASFGPFDGPVVQPRVDISIFANDISFSNPHPDPATAQTVYATIHNNSGRDASNFTVRLVNQNDPAAVYPDITVPFLSGANGSLQVSWNITTPATPNWCPMQVIIDNGNALDESNELDNQAIRPFINGQFNLPGDIAITAAAAPSTIQVNQGLSIQGSAWYRNTAVQLADSSCAGATVTARIVETNQAITGYTNSLGNYAISFPHGPATPGNYHVAVTITDYTLEGDSSTQFSVLYIPCNAPDLTSVVTLSPGTILPQNPSYNTRYIKVGDQLTGSIQVANGGNAASVASVLQVTLPDGTPVPGPFNTPALAPNARATVTLPAMQFNTVGNTYIQSTADQTNSNNENCNGGGEFNNSSAQSIVVLPNLPDINPVNTHYPYIQSNNCSPFPSASFTVRNLGGVPTGAFQAKLTVRLGSTVLAELYQMVSSIDPLWDRNISFPYTYGGATGVYTLTLECDVPGAVTEYNETNNSTSFQVNVTSCTADLTVYGCGNLNVDPVDPAHPGNATVTAILANSGQVPVSGPIAVRFNVGGTIYTATFNGTLNPGNSAPVSATIATPAHGNNSLTVTADAAGAIAESNENNNSVTEKLCWEFSLMNGTCSQGAFMPASAAVHSALPIQMGLLNTGLYKAGSANVKFELSGPGITGWLNLGTAGTAIGNNCACPVGVRLNNPYVFSQLGTYTLRVTADPDAEYTECDESNNVLLHQISIYQPRPDYVTRSEFIAPSLLNPDVDEPISIDLSYRNQGVSGTDSFWVYAQVNNDALDSVRVTGMVAGTLNTVHLNRTWSSSVRGVHVIRAVVDHRNDVQENNELNNEATRAIVVGHAPNLLFRSFTVDNPAPVVGTDLALHAVIENAGASDCVATLQFLYKNNSGQDVLITQRSITVDSAGTLAVLANWRVTDAHTRIFARIINGNPLEYNLDDNEAVASVGSMSIALTATPATCGNTADGVIRLAIDGGVAPYQRTWSTGATGDSIVVAPGTYTVTVVDVEGTVRNDTVTVSGNGASCDGITTVVSAASICAGSPVTVSFTAAGTFLGGNQFVAQLSDATGSFASPVTIGTLAAAGSGSISALIPAGTPGGSGYRIRVVSTTPALIGSDNGTDLTISPVSAVNLVNNQVVCAGASLPAITFTGVGSSFAWTNDNPAIGLAASGTGDIASFTAQNTTTGMLTATIRVMALSGSCASKPVTFRISVKPAPTVAAQTSQDLCAGSAAAAVSFTGALPGTTYSWANDNTATGLAARGTGSIPAFTAVNNSAAVQVSIITVTPSAGGCTGTPETFTYTVRPSAGSIAYSGSPYCPSGWAYVQHAGSTGGTYSATPAGLAIDAATGAVNLAISQPGDYTVSYTVGAGGAGCSNIATAALSINASTTVSPIANQVLCAEVTTPPIAFTGTATSYSWTATGAAIGLAASGTGTSLPSFVTVNNGTATATAIVTISPLGNGGCPAGKPITFRISVAPKVVVDAIANQVYCKGVTATGVSFSSGVAGATYSWSRTPAAIGLAPASGAGAIPSFVTQNASASTLVSTVTVTATANKCSSVPVTFQYEVGNCITQSGGSGTGGVPTARIATALSRVVVGPNPTQGKVTIYLDSKSTATYTVRVTDQNGSVLGKTATFTGSSYSLDLGSLAAGTYLVLLADARTGEQVQRKIIKL